MTITEIKQRNRAAGQHFFDRPTMRFFRSIVHPKVYGDGYFVTSEQYESFGGVMNPRKWSVRKSQEDGSIRTVGEFQQYRTKENAIIAAKLAAGTAKASDFSQGVK